MLLEHYKSTSALLGFQPNLFNGETSQGRRMKFGFFSVSSGVLLFTVITLSPEGQTGVHVPL